MSSFSVSKLGLATLSLAVMIAGADVSRAQTNPAEPSAAQPSTSSSTSTVTPHHRMRSGHRGRRHAMSPAEAVDHRIADLHRRLHITADQETLWNAVAQVMRDDAKAVEAAAKTRQEKLATMSALDNLRSFQQLAQTHADGLNKLSDTFAPLYAAMSDEQKKNADAVFRYQQPNGTAHGGRKPHR